MGGGSIGFRSVRCQPTLFSCEGHGVCGLTGTLFLAYCDACILGLLANFELVVAG